MVRRMVEGVSHQFGTRLRSRIRRTFQQDDFPNLGAQVHQAPRMFESSGKSASCCVRPV